MRTKKPSKCGRWPAVAALAYAALLPQAQAVNKCTDADGRVQYQDAPCTAKGETLDIRPASSKPGDALATFEAQTRLSTIRAENEMAAAIREKRPLVGMTVKQLNDALGLATKVNTDTSTGYVREQAIFERPNETWYVYTRNGHVESVQHRPGVPIGYGQSNLAHGLQSRPCPSAHEIRNAVTAASSIALSPEQIKGRWQHIKSMQECR